MSTPRRSAGTRSGARVRGPRSGGAKIPDALKLAIEQRILACAEEHFAGKYSRIDVRFRGQFCYVDAYEEPTVSPAWPPADWDETREQYIERIRNTPIHLCRLRYLGRQDEWSWAFYTYSNERYEPAVFGDGSGMGPPEDAFMVAAGLYLQG
ncbi:MAG: hypothetical protein PVH68_14870 [Armatimonadota bacterium]|jgi:hypothetical protein